MNLQRVTGGDGHKNAYLRCVLCEMFKPVHAMFADLDGEPFKAYICDWCAARNELKTPDKVVTL